MEGFLWILGVCLMSGGMFVAIRGLWGLGTALFTLGVLVGPGGSGLVG